MKRYFILPAFFAALSFVPFAAANDGGQPEVKEFSGEIPKEILDKMPKEMRAEIEKAQHGVAGKPMPKPKANAKNSPDVKVETFRFGKAITIGPDGKTEVKEFGGDIPKEVLDKLPKEIQDSIKNGPPKGALGGPVVNGKMKVIIDNNGKREEFESDLSDPNALKGLPQDIFGGLLKDKGNALPPEAKQALESAMQAMKAQGEQPHGQPHEQPRGQVKPTDDVSAKLDKILDRLERVEKDVKAIKAKNQ